MNYYQSYIKQDLIYQKGILKAVRIGEKKIRRYRPEDIKKFIKQK